MTYYRSLLALASVAIFHASVPNYLFIQHGIGLPKYWVIGYCVLAFPFIIKQMANTDILKSPVMIWCFGYAWLSVMWFFLSSQSDGAWQEVRSRFLAIIEIVAFLSIFGDLKATRLARQVIVVTVIFGIILNIYELFVPMTFSEVLGRSAGFYMNPNLSGEALVLGMIVSASVLPAWCRGPYILLSGVGIFVTFSRSGILAWLLAASGLLYGGRVDLRNLLRTAFISFVFVGVVLLPRWDDILTTFERTAASNKNIVERLDWLTDPTGVSDQSSWSRKYLLQQAWTKAADHPWLGSGTGTSYEAFDSPPHNQYLALIVDHGFLGVAILPLLVLTVIWGRRGESRYIAMLFGCIVMFLGFFTHGILGTSHTLLLFALVAGMASTDSSAAIEAMKVKERKNMGAAKSLVNP